MAVQFLESGALFRGTHWAARTRSMFGGWLPSPRGAAGVTLVELLITLAIAAILLAIGVPAFQNMVATNRIAALTNELSAALQLARSEAMSRGQRVTVCKSSNAEAAAPTCSPSANWADGWLVFVDGVSGGVEGTFDGSDLRLRAGKPASGDATVTTVNFADYVVFRPDGQNRGSSGLANGSFAICIAPNERRIVINTVGRIRIETGTCP